MLSCMRAGQPQVVACGSRRLVSAAMGRLYAYSSAIAWCTCCASRKEYVHDGLHVFQPGPHVYKPSWEDI
jgi:hypothetical protein